MCGVRRFSPLIAISLPSRGARHGSVGKLYQDGMHPAWRTYPSKVSSLLPAIMQRTADVVPDTMVEINLEPKGKTQ